SNPLSITAGVGDSYRYNIVATNPAGGTLNYALSAGPAGMTVDKTGFVNWTAGFVATRVKITITDGKGGKIVHGYLLPLKTTLSLNAPVIISGGAGTEGYATVD